MDVNGEVVIQLQDFKLIYFPKFVKMRVIAESNEKIYIHLTFGVIDDSN